MQYFKNYFLSSAFICSFFPSFLIQIRLLVLDLSSFVIYAFNVINFLLSTGFAVSHKFDVLFLLSV